MLDKYRDYFDIDPEYFPQVNEDIINNHPDHWKKFYPHETFVRLLKDTISVLSRKQRVSLWVEGAYGTGKSHAVLTLKKLLEASEKDTKEYFDKFHDQLNNDLLNSLQQIKNCGQKILTVHRYGSSNISGDGDMVFAIQESIANALDTQGFKGGNAALKDSAIKWLSEEWAKEAFNKLVKTEYTDIFNGDDVDTIISNLNTYTGEALKGLMSKIMLVGKEKHFSALTMDVDGLVEWIKEVIKENNLKAIVFIWDEFTHFFHKNKDLTGFQKIVDVSGSNPFYMIIVTHDVTHIFPKGDKEWKKIMDRFVQPICNIELPENMAFRLMGEAMEENKDSQVQADWKETRSILYERTYESRELVKNKTKISDVELKKILPIHPYAALLLKHISSAFDSNQRSMFEFIKNDRGDEIKGFQWFIDNYGPYDINPLLTIDMLWDFFYEKGKEFLSHDIRAILDCYPLAESRNLNADESRVLKTVLLLQAISQKTGDSVELFIPNERNLNNAFEGSDMENDEAVRIANSLIPDLLFKKVMSGGKTQYSALINTTNTAELEKERDKQLQKPTSQLLQECDISSVFDFTPALKLRYELRFVSKTDFRSIINNLRASEDNFGNKIIAVIAFAKDDMESMELGKLIREVINDESYHMIFIDASTSPMGKDLLEQYADAMSNSVVNIKQDKSLARQYEQNAKDVLKKWCMKIKDGEFVVYSADKKEGERANSIDLLYSYLERINRKKYPYGLENGGNVTATMWNSNPLATGALCGIKEEVSGTFRSSNVNTKLENYIGDAWQTKDYWIKNSSSRISIMKIEVKNLIDKTFEEKGQISIREIYDFFKNKDGKYGFMPCNLTAFVLGFLLKEYKDGSYNWSDGIYNEPLTEDKLKEMISEIIKHQNTPIPRYKDKFIGTMKPEEKAFNEASSKIFGIPVNLCISAESTRDKIRQKMKEMPFPLWCLKYNLDGQVLKTLKEKVLELIDNFIGIANSSNYGGAKSDKEIAMQIGRLCIDNQNIVDDLASIVNIESISNGMNCYLMNYSDGILISLAEKVGDGGQYINRLKDKFKVDAANWVWNIDTANQKIDEVITEYKIIVESNNVLPKNVSFDSTIHEWCEHCRRIRISYLYAKNYWDDLSDFMGLLYNIKKSGHLLDSQREKFLEQIKINGAAFNAFYNSQTELFKKACSFILGKLGDEEVKDIFASLHGDMFTMEKSTYQVTVENAVKNYISKQGSEKLRELWREKTNSDSPKEWSKKHQTPILCMIDDKEMQSARQAFDTLNKKQADSSSIEKATQYFKNATFFDRLSDDKAIDEAFRTSIVKSYSTMLDDLNDVRDYLQKNVSVETYYWFGLPEVDKKLEKMAEHEYNASGCEKALAKIDDMDIAEVKQYLKRLIKDNMVVGMEIIKGE